MKRQIIVLALILNSIYAFSQTQSKLETGDTLGPWHIINFDDSINYLRIDTSLDNVWQIGTPQKPFFNTALSLPHAIVTDTINHYPINNHSFFDLYIGEFNYGMFYQGNIFIDFWHKFDTDTLKDGGYITVSRDKGQTWHNIIEDTINGFMTPSSLDPSLSNLYTPSDILYNGEYGFSGKSNGWMHTTFAWQQIFMKPILPDTMILRFNFISDSVNTNKEGWMIDDIRLFSIESGGDVDEYINTNAIKVTPNPFNSTTELLLSKSFKKVEIYLNNLEGKLMKKYAYYNCDKITLDRNGLDNGFYYIRVVLDDKYIQTKKIIVTN